MPSLILLSCANSKLQYWLKDLRKSSLWNFKGKLRFSCNLADLSSRQKWSTLFLIYMFSSTLFHLTFSQASIFCRKTENMEKYHSSGIWPTTWTGYLQKKIQIKVKYTENSGSILHEVSNNTDVLDWKMTVFSCNIWTVYRYNKAFLCICSLCSKNDNAVN